jgi:anti-sigma factor RsiW
MGEQHPDRKALEKFLGGRLAEPDSRALERHLFTCAPCEA